MNILIVGGSGHVSGALTRTALAAGHGVWTVTRGKRPLLEGATSLIAERHDKGVMEAVVAEQNMVWDLVVDCICYELDDIRQDIDLFYDRAARFVLVSTDFVYDPFHRSFPQPEETDRYVTPEDGSPAYGWKKRLCELELIERESRGLEWTIVRPCHIYGPPSELGCIPLHGRDPKLIASLRAGTSLQLVGGGRFLQQPVLADDLAETILSMADNSTSSRRIFNAAGNDVIESWQYYQIVADTLGVDLNVEEVPVKSYLTEHPESAPFICHRFYDISSLREAGLSVPSTPIETGIRRHVEYLLGR
jgi:nucleoside-diphosphate-sugar epimerase